MCRGEIARLDRELESFECTRLGEARQQSQLRDAVGRSLCMLAGGSSEGWRLEDGRRIWAQTSVAPLFVQEALAGFACVTHDLTGAVQHQQGMKRAEARFHAMMEYSAVGLALLDVEGRWLQVNRAICELLGYTSEELLARTFQELTHPDDLDLDMQHVRALLAGEISSYRLEKRYVRKDGMTVWGLLAVALVQATEGTPA